MRGVHDEGWFAVTAAMIKTIQYTFIQTVAV